MATAPTGDFENALRRLEEIVAKLEGESISLDESVALFREGKTLAGQCETLLKTAQTSIEAASRGDGLSPVVPAAAPGQPSAAAPGQPAAAGSAPPPSRPARSATPLFAETIVDDADPDL